MGGCSRVLQGAHAGTPRGRGGMEALGHGDELSGVRNEV